MEEYFLKWQNNLKTLKLISNTVRSGEKEDASPLKLRADKNLP